MSFNHKTYLDQFLSDYKAGKFQNNSVAQVTRSFAVPKYQIIGVHHLTAAENVGNHNLYIDIINIDGHRMRNRVEWGWMGQRPDEKVNPVNLDKPMSEPSGNISIWAGQVIWAKVLGQDSDIISGVTTLLPDEGPGNTIGHHSHYVVWLWVENPIDPLPPVDPLPISDWEQKYNDLVKQVKDLAKGL